MIGLSVVGVIVLIVIGLTFFLNLSLQFGKCTIKQQNELYALLENFQNKKMLSHFCMI